MTLAAPIIMLDGSIVDLVELMPSDIHFGDMGVSLSRQVRWSGRHRPSGISVAQHSVMGADAIYRETGGDKTAAGYFLVHDGHEYLIGDQTRPAVKLFGHWVQHFLRGVAHAPDVVEKAVKAAKAAIDACIHAAAGLEPIAGKPHYQRLVEEMDERMCKAEAVALYGPRAAIPLLRCDLPDVAVNRKHFDKPWLPMVAEEEFFGRMNKFLDIDARPR